ncbi:MAG: hypothetical protein ACPGEA_02500, partial [Acholeplasmataceae bacterium]
MWNLNDLYHGFDDNYEIDIKKLEKMTSDFRSLVSKKDTMTPVQFLETYLSFEEKMTKHVRTLYAYASLRYSSNVNDPEPLQYMARLDRILKTTTKENVMFTRYLKTLDLDSLSASSTLIKNYLYNLEREQESANY